MMAGESAAAQQIDTAAALGALREVATACAADAGTLWAHSLCGPVALTDSRTRLLVTNDSAIRQPYLPFGAAFVTTAPAGVGFANTSFDWARRSWAMIMLPLPTERFERVTLLMHEVFHREQHALGLDDQDPPNNQLDEKDGRIWFRLELRALAAALDTLGDEPTARRRAEDAMLFRARRRVVYPLADSLEPALEMQEGLAEYTGERLAMSLTGESVARVARHVEGYQSSASYVRSFAYATGPALGVLLDRFAPDWKRQVRTVRDPARLLAASLRVLPPRDIVRASDDRARQYGMSEIVREETARDSARRGPIAAYRAHLVDGPTLTLSQSWLGRNFNPQSLVGFDIRNTVYPTGTFNSEWGTLEVASGGALLSNDQKTLRVAAPPVAPAGAARTVAGEGWTLTLKPGWALRPLASRPGSYVVGADTSVRR